MSIQWQGFSQPGASLGGYAKEPARALESANSVDLSYPRVLGPSKLKFHLARSSLGLLALSLTQPHSLWLRLLSVYLLSSP